MKIALIKGALAALTILASMTCAQNQAVAGSVSIYNDNCAIIFTQRIYVHVYPQLRGATPGQTDVNSTAGCTDTNPRVRKGETITVTLAPNVTSGTYEGKKCNYHHEAGGTTGGDSDVSGRETSSVTCRNDWAGVCQCKKD